MSLRAGAKQSLADEETACQARDLMAELNHAAAEVMREIGVNACTDITGFGLLGHLYEMTSGSGVNATINADAVPTLKAAVEFAGGDVVPGGTLNNLAYVEPYVDFDSSISKVTRLVLADAQTSGGLLISVPQEKTEDILRELHSRGVKHATQIGVITGSGPGRINVKP